MSGTAIHKLAPPLDSLGENDAFRVSGTDMSRCHVILRRVGLDAYELLDFDLSREDPEHASLGVFVIHGQDATFKPNAGGKDKESILSVRSLAAKGSASEAGVSDLRIWRGARQLLSLIDADERPGQA